MLKDIAPGPASSLSWNAKIIECAGQVYFSGYDGATTNLWKTDGTPAGTVLVKGPLPQADDSGPMVALGTKVVFSGYDPSSGWELWITDGTSAGTTLITDLVPGPESPFLEELVAYKGKVYFAATTSATGRELWVTDGTAAGTSLLKDINSGAESSNPANLVVWNDRLYFCAYDPIYGTELWASDGTGAGTNLVADIHAGWRGSIPSSLTPAGSRLYFTAYTDALGSELYSIFAPPDPVDRRPPSGGCATGRQGRYAIPFLAALTGLLVALRLARGGGGKSRYHCLHG
jgi:ELWxxDGT repeat protein